MATVETYTNRMLAVLVAAAVYQFPVNKTMNYALDVQFDGYVPVLGGIDGKIDVALKMAVVGMTPDKTAVRLAADLTDAEIRLDGEKMPFTVDNLKQFFPKNTIGATELGEIKENDAPDLKLPVRLPGLDVKRIPEISYMPIQFPADMADGKTFTYKKPFGDSDVEYEVTPKFDGSTIHFAIKMKQSYAFMEDDAHNKIDEEKDAKFDVKTEVTGAGNIDFDSAKGRVISSKIVADANSVVTERGAGTKTERKLKTTLICKLVK